MSLVCAQCHCCPIEWKPCAHCGGSGYVPSSTSLAEFTAGPERCGICRGAGGRWTCSGGCSPESGPHPTTPAKSKPENTEAA